VVLMKQARHLVRRLEMSLALTDFCIDVANFVIAASLSLDR
jgi:hypothetical protein